ncbi:MAG: redoxin domain-containing protein [Holophagales bacterium]|nr:redoxin domain-containing protein [Holophagales bacterium]MYJ26310.1 redoxin domain-containing protein [Holophagales bacterium]
MRSLVPAAMLATAVSLAPASAGAADLAVGDAAPDFTLPSTDGSQVTLSTFAGRKNVVLAFFPKAFTAG